MRIASKRSIIKTVRPDGTVLKLKILTYARTDGNAKTGENARTDRNGLTGENARTDGNPRTCENRLKPETQRPALQTDSHRPSPGILWIHGGGYMLGGTYMSPMTCAPMLAKHSGATIVFPEYRLAWQSPFPAALEDCYAALEWMYDNADEIGIDRSRIVVGGESAGGGLAAAVCIYARDKGRIPIAMQLPLYPMIDSEDTATSSDNHSFVWNTRLNHWAWKHYIGAAYGTDNVSKYASPARETDYHGLPPCYTFVCEGEPFYEETLTYISNLKDAGVPADIDIYPGSAHAFDMLKPWSRQGKLARRVLLDKYMERVMY